MIDLEELKKLALAAMPGPWTYEVDDFSGKNWLVGSLCTGIPDDRGHWVHVTTDRVRASELGAADAQSTAEYIAAANPATMLELIERVRLAETTIGKLREDLKSLRLKTSEQERFIWWIHQVYARNVQDLIAEIMSACTYQDEPTAASGKYGLPKKCFDNMERLSEYSHGIYDGTYFYGDESAERTFVEIQRLRELVQGALDSAACEADWFDWVEKAQNELKGGELMHPERLTKIIEEIYALTCRELSEPKGDEMASLVEIASIIEALEGGE